MQHQNKNAMELFLKTVLIIHIVSGFTALITGFLSMLNRKGSSRHRLTGKIFFVGMTGVFISATIISISKSLAFLFMVGFFSYYLACSGYRSLYLKKLHLKQKPKALDWLISLTGIIAGIALILFSIGWFSSRGPWGLVPLIFGSFCVVSGLQDISGFYYRPKNKQHWIITHGGRMGGSFAATLTAFIVVNVSIGAYTWVLWILPGALTAVWISMVIKAYLQKSKAVQSIAVVE
jgi:uncharacterized membrane protein